MELKDPLKNRIVTSIPPPLALSLKHEQLFDKNTVNYNLLRKFYKREGKLSKPLYMELIRKAKSLYQKEPNIIRLDDPVTIVGDIHGQYYDLVNIIDQDFGGSFQETKYLFLGDYVDRGCFGVEVVGLLSAIKIAHPHTVFMLRGNHECRQMALSFNFKTECLYKYDQEVFQLIMQIFDTYPLAAIVNDKFLCVHGGITTAVGTIAEIMKINRFLQIPRSGGYCDLMWADPVDTDDGKQKQIITFNNTRGCSYFFGVQMAQRFLAENKLQSIIRAHQVQNQGYKAYFWAGMKEFPTVITIFSAPNYCDYYQNKGAILKFNKNHFQIQQIEQVQHPYVLPDFQDIISWSFPFVCKNILQVWNHLYKPQTTFDQKDAVPLFLIGKQKVLSKVLDNLQTMTKSLMHKIQNQTPIPSDKLLQLPQLSQLQLQQKAERQVQTQKIVRTELLQTIPSLGIRKINVEDEKRTLQNKIEFHRRKTLDLGNQKRPQNSEFKLLLPQTQKKEQKKNAIFEDQNQESLPNRAD